MERYDVVVIGGGAGGFPAAVQAARAGARTLLVEKNAALGGTTTMAGVFTCALFHAWGKQVISGIGWEAVTRAMSVAGTPLPNFADWSQPHYRLAARVTPALYAGVLDELVLDSGADLLLHTMLADVVREGDGWQVRLCGKEGLHTVWARTLVDASGDANAVGMLDLERRTSEELQPGTLMFRLGGYDAGAVDDAALSAAYRAAIADGRLHENDFNSRDDPLPALVRGRGVNKVHVVDIRAATSLERTHAEIQGRRVLMRLVTFLRSQPGLEGVTVDSWSPETGIRETCTAVGEVTITGDDYASGRLWDDAISYSFFPIDVHTADGVDFRPLEPGTYPTIPRAALVPRGERSLLVSGRAISADRVANSAARVQASCMAIGQAAGANAALAADRGLAVMDVPVDDVRALVRAHGAIVPGDPGAPTPGEVGALPLG